MRAVRTVALALLLLGAACSTLPEGQRSDAPVTGPPEIEPATIERHAAQFDEEEPVREPGSQQELAASAYIVAHVTDAGYVFRLDAVPVRDLVRSTNVVALPPGGEEAGTIVVAGYDSTETSEPNGHAIGVWLEVARALRVVDRAHGVQFVALGAEETQTGDGRLGSRRLAQQLSDDGRSPAIVVIGNVEAGGERVEVSGAAEEAIRGEAASAGVPVRVVATGEGSGTAGVFTAAGFDTTLVEGGAEAVARVLLAHLATL
ncbi:MAG TPA: M28 family peptidase [Actinomycetota bacterium]|nr:M28 family peptidase [Actinomycetota bacterium]